MDLLLLTIESQIIYNCFFKKSSYYFSFFNNTQRKRWDCVVPTMLAGTLVVDVSQIVVTRTLAAVAVVVERLLVVV